MSILTKAAVKTAGFKRRACATLAALCCLINLTAARADGSLGEINIRMTGTVVALGCTVDPDDIDKPVQLGSWATKQLKKAGRTTSPVAFSIHLTGCTASGVTTAFTGTKDSVNPQLLALSNGSADDATGVAVQIMDSLGTRIPMGDTAPRGVVDDNGNLTLNFRANYVALGDNSVKPGDANADTEFTLTYD
ncbi:fimbrial protein [Erwinia amylovora]